LRSDLIPSGIGPIDSQLEGLIGGRTYVLSGAPGTGKSIACLQFLSVGLAANERVAILTQDDPEDLISQGEFLGLDLAREIASERLYLLRFSLDFARRFSRAASPDIAFAELRTLLGPTAPSRFVIDSVVPFVDAGGASDSAASQMLKLLEDLGSTSLVTYPGDIAGVYDRRLDPLIQRAAAIFHLAADRQRHRHVEIRKVRYRVPSVSPIPYRIEPVHGLVLGVEDIRWHAEEPQGPGDRQRFVIDLPPDAAADALRLLQSHYSVKVSGSGHGARVLPIGKPTPVRPLSAMPARRSADFSDLAAADLPLPKQPMKAGARAPFDAAGFRGALQAMVALDPRAPFSVVALTPPPGELQNLTGVVLETVRAINGDLVAVSSNQVLIYLHGTGRKHAPCFVDRLRERWQQVGHGEPIVDIVAYPADQDRIRSLLGAVA
jgi:circadian clock protein KaiC